MPTPVALAWRCLRRLGFWWLSLATLAMPFVVPALIADEPAAMLGGAWWSAAAFSWAACAFVAGPLALFCALLHSAVLSRRDRCASRRVDRRNSP